MVSEPISCLIHNDNTFLLGMVDNKVLVLIEVPPPLGSTSTHACQHYADGHTNEEGPSRSDLAERLGKQAVTFGVTKVPALSESSHPPAPIPPLTHAEKPPTSQPHIYMQSHKATAKDADVTIISSLPEVTPTPSSKPKPCKWPLSVDEIMLGLDDNSNSDERKGREVGNIFQSGTTVCRGRGRGKGAASKCTLRKFKDESKKSGVEAKKSKYKSARFINDSPSLSPSPSTTTTSACWLLPQALPHPVLPDALSKLPPLASLEPHQPPTISVGNVESLAHLMQPPPLGPHSMSSSQDDPQQQWQ